jgi:ABC-2 type transport system ATP-binding protein
MKHKCSISFIFLLFCKGMSILSIRNVSKYYGDKKVLNQISLEVPKGSIYGLLGPNGAGKTTLIRIINQITGPDEGEVIFNGEQLGLKHIFEIGYLPEERGLYKKMQIADQMLYFARLKGLSKAEALKRIRYWFDKFNIMSWKSKKIEDLSKGMQQKIQFIATILHNPQLLILDEPFTGLDPVNADLIRDEIIELKKNGTTVIFSTHRMESVEYLCDNIALLNLANKVLDGSTKEIKRQYSRNLYHIVLQGEIENVNLDPVFVIENKAYTHGTTQISVIMPPGQNNALLANLMRSYSILEFNEKIPLINDIFKMKVAETGGVMGK